MRRILGVLAITAGLGLAAPASAHWQTGSIAPSGYPWAACSAPYDCGGPLYTRRLVGYRAVIVRHHRAHPLHRQVRRTVHRRWSPRSLHAAYVVRGAFQYIDDPHLAAVLAWGDIVNAEAPWR
jgi:hypothetical protein